MARKPAENTPFGDMIMSFEFSTEMEDPLFNDVIEEEEHWKDKTNTKRNSRVNNRSILLVQAL